MPQEKIAQVVLFMVMGLLSGWVSSQVNFVYENGFIYIPGLVFGIGILIIYLLQKKAYSYKWLLWLGLSTFAYYAAVQSSLFFETEIKSVPFLIAGVVGAMIVSLGFNLLHRITLLQGLVLVTMGGILGVIGTSIESESYQLLFVIWQGGIAAGLGYVATSNPEIKIK